MTVFHCEKHDRLFEGSRCPECQAQLLGDLVVLIIVAVAVAFVVGSAVLPAAALLENK
jgi:hypothetical protein